MRYLLFIFLFPFTVLAQDALHLINGGLQTGNVKAIDDIQIKFTKPENKFLLYGIKKNNVLKIKYHDGKIDSFPNQERLNNQTLAVEVESIRQEIVQKGKKLYCFDQKLNDKNFVILIRAIGDKEIASKLEKQYLYVHKLKRSGRAFFISGAVVAGSFATLMLAASDVDATLTAQFSCTMAITGAVLAVLPSSIIRKKYLHKRKELAVNYNEMGGSTSIKNKF